MAYELNLQEALEKLQSRYRLLSLQASRFVELMKEGALPAVVQEAHGAAVHEYLQYGRELFDNLEKMGLQVQQVTVPKEGQPEKVLTISAPLIPSPSLPGDLSSAPVNSVGAIPAAIIAVGGFVVRVVSSQLAKTLAKWVIGGYLTMEALKLVIIVFHGYPLDQMAVNQSTSFITMVDELQAKGISAKDAADTALSVFNTIPKQQKSYVPLLIAGIGLASVAYVFTQVYGNKHG